MADSALTDITSRPALFPEDEKSPYRLAINSL